jgi:hypothetical protein
LKNVEAQAHRAIDYDSFFRVFDPVGIQRDDEHLPLRFWCPTSKPIFDLLIADSPATSALGQKPTSSAPSVRSISGSWTFVLDRDFESRRQTCRRLVEHRFWVAKSSQAVQYRRD